MDSSKKPEGSPAPEAAASKATTPPAQPVKPKAKGYSNPALQAMGIPRLRIPSRNWSIFWGVVFGVSGLIIYDRRERKNRRQFWKDQVSQFSTIPMEANELPRRITVYMAPPPNDYIEITQKHFRQYIKPVLTSAAVDYTVVSESRQGEIRAKVAEEVRNKRRKMRGLSISAEDPSVNKNELEAQIEKANQRDTTGGVICVGRGAYKEYINGLQEGWLGPLEAPTEPEPEAKTIEAAVETITENSVPVESLDAATTLNAEQQLVSSPIPQATTTEKEQLKAAEFPNPDDDERRIMGYDEPEPNPEEGEGETSGEKKKDTKPPVTKPYILGMNRGVNAWSAELPAGADADLLAARPEDISDPIAILEHRHVLGIVNTPIRIKRFFSQRFISDILGRNTAAIVFNEFRPFRNGISAASGDDDIALKDFEVITDNSKTDGNSITSDVTPISASSSGIDAEENDADRLIIAETQDWPSRWKTKALENNSEWIWPFSVDNRLASKLRVYDFSRESDEKFKEAKKNYSRWKKEQKELEAAKLKELEVGPSAESREN